MVHETLTPEQRDNHIFNTGMAILITLTIALTATTALIYYMGQAWA